MILINLIDRFLISTNEADFVESMGQ